jgi:hypothetical protein
VQTGRLFSLESAINYAGVEPRLGGLGTSLGLTRIPVLWASSRVRAKDRKSKGAVFRPLNPNHKYSSTHWPGAFSRFKSHAPLVGCVGRVGGVIHGGAEKLKNSAMLSAPASRAVSGGRLNRASMSFRIAV